MLSCAFLSRSYILFTEPAITYFSKFFLKNESYDTINIFENYVATLFSVFSLQFSTISGIQTDQKIQSIPNYNETPSGVHLIHFLFLFLIIIFNFK